MKILGINHVGLAPKDPQKARWFFDEVLGLPLVGEELVAAQATNTVIFGSDSGDILPRALLEILENDGDRDGPVKSFLAKKGSGIHHLALTVDDIGAAIARMKDFGVTLINEEPKPGVCATQIVFVHPNSTGGLLIELVQEPQI